MPFFSSFIKRGMGFLILAESGQNLRAYHVLREEKNNQNSMSYNANSQIKTLTRKAFHDIGFRGPVDVIVKNSNNFNATCVPFLKGTQRAALVIVESDIENYNYSQIYAILGHEAAHAYRNHIPLIGISAGFAYHMLVYINSLPRILFPVHPVTKGLSNILNIFMPLLLVKMVQYQCEMDADIFSARRLGTAKELISAHLTFQNLEKNFDKPSFIDNLKIIAMRILSPHPSTSYRVQQLEKLSLNIATQKSMFFFNSEPEKSSQNNPTTAMTTDTSSQSPNN
jgi:Zn-dependent protease with chaperone function